MLSMYENDTTLYMIAHIHKEKGKVKDLYRIIVMMADGSIGVDMTRCAKLGDLKSMQERLDDIADANEWRWHGKRKAPYEIEDLPIRAFHALRSMSIPTGYRCSAMSCVRLSALDLTA